jgi:hypothetical protein
MHTHGHTTVWGTHIGVGRATDGQSWYQQVKAWWATHKAAHQQAALDALHRCWDAKREAVRPLHADAAIDMVAVDAFSVTLMLYGLSQ